MKFKLVFLFFFCGLRNIGGSHEDESTIYYTALQGSLIIPLVPSDANHHHWHRIAPESDPIRVTVRVLNYQQGSNNNNETLLQWRGSANQVNATFPCGAVHRAGLYVIESVYEYDNKEWLIDRRQLKVTWPPMVVQAPSELYNYRNAFQIKVQWVHLKCYPPPDANVTISAQLVHCGRRKNDEKCSSPLVRATQSIPDVWQVAGLVKDVRFDCNALDHPGFYRILIISSFDEIIIGSSNPIQVLLNTDFQLQLRAKFVRPCSRELPIFYRRPVCLNGTAADRVRFYAKTFANDTMDYVGERILETDKSVVAVPCRLFDGRTFDAVCFRYVNTAADGVSVELIETCIPGEKTSVKAEPNWGPWSKFSSCTARYCQPGIRYRYRYCDQPPPQYPGSFCSGHPIEWENCIAGPCNNTTAVMTSVESPPTFSTENNIDISSPQVATSKENLTSYCQCGCVLQLDNGFTFSLVVSMALCPENHLKWQFSVTRFSQIRLQLDYLRMDCQQEDDVLIVRDGVSGYSPLIGLFDGGRAQQQQEQLNLSQMITSSSKLMLEMNSTRRVSGLDDQCVAGFIATIQPINELEWSSFKALKSKWLPPPVLTLSGLLMIVFFIASILAVIYTRCRIKVQSETDEMTSIRSEGSEYQLLSTTMVTSLSHSSLHHDLSETDNKKFDSVNNRLTLQQRSLPNTPYLSTAARRMNKSRLALIRSSTMSPKSFRRQLAAPIHHWVNKTKSEAIELKLMKRSLTDSLSTLKEEKVLNTNSAAAGFVLVEDDDSSTTANNTLTTISCSTLFDHQDQDLELDYYDLDVRNAGRDAPDSFLRCVSTEEEDETCWDEDILGNRDLYKSNPAVDAANEPDAEVRDPLL